METELTQESLFQAIQDIEMWCPESRCKILVNQNGARRLSELFCQSSCYVVKPTSFGIVIRTFMGREIEQVYNPYFDFVRTRMQRWSDLDMMHGFRMFDADILLAIIPNAGKITAERTPKMYSVSSKEAQEIQSRFTYHPPVDGINQTGRYEVIRSKALGLANTILSLCPPSRERSVAITKLDEVVMFANAAIARNEPNATTANFQSEQAKREEQDAAVAEAQAKQDEESAPPALEGDQSEIPSVTTEATNESQASAE